METSVSLSRQPSILHLSFTPPMPVTAPPMLRPPLALPTLLGIPPSAFSTVGTSSHLLRPLPPPPLFYILILSHSLRAPALSIELRDYKSNFAA